MKKILLLIIILLLLLFIYPFGNTIENTIENKYININKDKIFNLQDCEKYVINLDRSSDRRKSFEYITRNFPFNIKRISAIDAKDININEYPYNKILESSKSNMLRNSLKKKPETLGHFACYLSHIKVYKDFLKTNKQYCMIFEDDFDTMTNNFTNDLLEKVKNVPDDWNIILTGYHIDDEWDYRHKKGNKDLKNNNGVLNITYFAGTHCYIINRKTINLILEYLKEPVWYIDWHMSDLAKDKKINIYGLYKPIACQPAVHKIKVNNINFKYNCKNSFRSITNNKF
jgi:GR25 family glycosyltransferase involved in LPS biosynthesis